MFCIFLACYDIVHMYCATDRTNIGKRLHVINVTFTIPDEGTKAMSADENHLVPVIKEAENYDKLEKALADIRRDVYLHLI